MIKVSDFEESGMENAIAIIGMGGRFPGAKTLEEFWDNLYNGVESVRFFNRGELLKMGIDKNLLDNPKFVAADAILDDIDMFDASFFDYSAREAEIMDPQHRLFLETAWEVLERAGYSSELYDGRIAVYAGANMSSYMIRNLYSNPGLVRQLGSFKIMLANGQDFLATKVSHKMNLMGPSVNVNTLCSSSMVAVHFACRSLLSYDCDIALAGGVSFQVTRNEAFFYQEGGIGSSDGHCRAFDSKANGTVSGSGLGIVALKRLEDAIEDGDYIHAVIRGTAINNDGAVKNSYTAPSVDGQAECIAEAIAMSGVDPETITYIDAHGTGTNLGDPIEIAALTKAYGSYTDKKQYCAIGSVKTNIGHLVHAGGLASLVKTVLSMQHRMIPPSLNFEEPNPKIDFVNTPFYVNSKLSKWESGNHPLRAGVSSFGIGGTNTHVILEEAPKAEPSQKSGRACQLIILSAKTGTALEKMSSNLAEYVDKNPGLELADIAFTLQVGRKNFSHKRALVCSTARELANKLQALPPEQVFSHFQKSKEQTVAFVFPKNDCQYADMGRELYRTEQVYKDAVDKCAELINPLLGFDICKIICDGVPAQTDNNENISRSFVFVTEYALAKLLMEWEVVPALMIGEGVGEYAAACVSGVFSLEDAIRLVLLSHNALADAAGKFQFQNPRIPFISSKTGKMIGSAEAVNPDYWVRLTDSSDNFDEGLKEILKDSNQIVMWLGSDGNKTISRAGNDTECPIILAMPDFQNKGADLRALFESLGKFWAYGGKVNWNKLYVNEKRHMMPLPAYPFERQRYWIEAGNQNAQGGEEVQILAKRPRPELETAYIAPRNDTEKLIAGICEEILGYEQVGVNDDFFELGGHSLLAVAFIAKLRKAFKKDISLESLFENTTVAKLGVVFAGSLQEDGGSQDNFEEGTL